MHISINSRKCVKNIIIIILVTIVILIGLTLITVNRSKETDFLYDYFYARYEDLNSENFHERMQALEKYYTKEFLAGGSWLVNEDNLSQTAMTIETYQIITEILSLELEETDENQYTVKLYVLYRPQLEPDSTHYTCYKMHIELVETLLGYKIDHADILQNFPVFTGGQEIVLGSEYEDEYFAETEHHHH